MIQLILAATFFCGIHFIISGTRLRDAMIARFGEKIFRAGFSLLSLFGLGWLIFAYRHAPYLETWGQLQWFKPIAALVMPAAFLLVVAGITTPNPTVVGGEPLLNQAEPRGILRITRHPFLWGISLWALVHLIANGDTAALVLFGSLLLLTLSGTHSIDAKRRRACGEAWEKFAAVTSNIPFMAIKEGRNFLKPGELGGWRLVLALVLYLILLHFHKMLFGVSPLF